ncbi:hypothetical protein WFZ59_004837, partial [Escherichia coli]
MHHEEMSQCFSRLENEIAELNKKLSVLVTSEDEKNAAMNRRRRFMMVASKLLAGPLRIFCRKSYHRPHCQKSTPLRLKVPERKAINAILLRLHRIKPRNPVGLSGFPVKKVSSSFMRT